jgi:hypothetical protein
MQKIYRDPLYRYSRELSFEIPESLREQMECEDYLETPREVRREKRGRKKRRRRR